MLKEQVKFARLLVSLTNNKKVPNLTTKEKKREEKKGQLQKSRRSKIMIQNDAVTMNLLIYFIYVY